MYMYAIVITKIYWLHIMIISNSLSLGLELWGSGAD